MSESTTRPFVDRETASGAGRSGDESRALAGLVNDDLAMLEIGETCMHEPSCQSVESDGLRSPPQEFRGIDGYGSHVVRTVCCCSLSGCV